MNNKPVRGDYVPGSPSAHPGVPVGNDRVPAWLAPNEFVVNKEATAMYGPQIEAMNNHGRAVQAQKGNAVAPVPTEAQYLAAGGLVDFLGSLFGQQDGVPVPQQVPVVQAAAPVVPQQVSVPVVPQQVAAPVVPQQMVAPVVPQQAVVPVVPTTQAPPAPKFDMFSGSGFGNYANAVASIESSGHKDPYSIYGGYNNHYVGKYQLGREAIKDASNFLGMKKAPSREEVRKNPQLQETLFNAFTQSNHHTLLNGSSRYRGMSPAEQQRYLGYAHNQGSGGALEFLKTNVAGKDGWGTAGTKYMTAIARKQGDNDWTPGDTAAGSMSVPGGQGPQSTPGNESEEPKFNAGRELAQLASMFLAGAGKDEITGVPQASMIPTVNSSGFIQQGGVNPVFEDPAYQVMAERSGLGAEGYWESLHPVAQDQHLDRINVDPDLLFEPSQQDVFNRVGANSGMAAIPADFDMAQTGAGRTGSPTPLAVPAIDNPPVIPSAETAIAAQAVPNAMALPPVMDTSPGIGAAPETSSMTPQMSMPGESIPLGFDENGMPISTADEMPVVPSTDGMSLGFAADGRPIAIPTENPVAPAGLQMPEVGNVPPEYTERGPRMMTDEEAYGILQNPNASEESRVNAQKHISGNFEVMSENQGPMTQEEAMGVLQDPNASPADRVKAEQAFSDKQYSGRGEAGMPVPEEDSAETDSTDSKAEPAVVAAVDEKVEEAVKVAEAEGESVPNDLTSKDAMVAGDKAATKDPAAFNDALGSIKNFFGDLFDAKELKRMAILYLGARISGASHGASLGFAGKSYLSRIDAKQTAYNKVAASGKYTKQSIDIFKKTRDYNDLALKALPTVQTGVLKTLYDADGKELRVEQVKNGDNTFYVDANGKQINPLRFSETKPADKEAQIQKSIVGLESMLSDLRTQNSYDPETKKYSNAILPAVDARKIAEWAVENGVPPEQMGSVIDASYHDMMNSKGAGREVRSLVPFIRQNVIRQKLGGNAGVFVVEPASDGKPAEYVAPHLLETLNRRASMWLGAQGAKGTSTSLSNQFYTAAMTDWNNLTVDERKKYSAGAGEGANGFYEFADDWLGKRNF